MGVGGLEVEGGYIEKGGVVEAEEGGEVGELGRLKEQVSGEREMGEEVGYQCFGVEDNEKFGVAYRWRRDGSEKKAGQRKGGGGEG